MQTALFALAAAIALLWCGVHLFIGGRQVAAPLRAAPLDPLVRNTQYLCWHFTSLSIAAMALFFALAAFGLPGFGPAGTLLAAGFALTGIGLAQRLGLDHGTYPQGWLFVPCALLGLGAAFF